jgi:hypothetical protein
MNSKILAATAAFVVSWLALKLWWAPPADSFAAVRMVGKGVMLGAVFFLAADWLCGKLAKQGGAS